MYQIDWPKADKVAVVVMVVSVVVEEDEDEEDEEEDEEANRFSLETAVTESLIPAVELEIY